MSLHELTPEPDKRSEEYQLTKATEVRTDLEECMRPLVSQGLKANMDLLLSLALDAKDGSWFCLLEKKGLISGHRSYEGLIQWQNLTKALLGDMDLTPEEYPVWKDYVKRLVRRYCCPELYHFRLELLDIQVFVPPEIWDPEGLERLLEDRKPK